MKKPITLYTALLLAVSINAQITFCDDFEGYQNGDPIAQTSTDWNTWGELMNGTTAPFTDDANVSNVLASNGNNSLYLSSGTTQGLQDVVLLFGSGAPYTFGIFEFSSMFYVNNNTGAYFNFQGDNVPGTTWSLDVKMDLGIIILENTGSATNYLTSTYPQGQWFELKINCDLTNNIWELFIDGISQGSFTNTVNQIASLDLYPIIGHEFYVDDICYDYVPFTQSSFPYDMSAIDLNLSSNLVLSAAPFTISGEVVNLSLTTVNSLDINYSINGAPPVVDNLTGLNLVLFDILPFNHIVDWTPPSTGTYMVEIWASNINGNVDMDTTNDVFSDSIYVWNGIAIRQPLIETFTSSTCPPCAPANVIAETLFAQNTDKYTSIKYQADFPGAGDPYFTQEGGNRRAYYAINSVPRMEIDGGWDQNGSSITQQVLDDHIEVVSFVNLSATYNINIKTIEVDIIIDPLENIQSNNLIVHTAIIEKTTFNNIGTNGETQFEHVVKKMVPNDSGTPITSLIGGTQSTLNTQHTFQGNYRLPANASNPINDATEHSIEDFSNLLVAVWIQDAVTKEVYQSTMGILSSIVLESFNCINNSCVDPLDGTGTYMSLANCDAVCNTTEINEKNKEVQLIYPNPATDNIYISNLTGATLLKIYDITGKLVLEASVSDKEYINISTLAKGIYQIKFEGKDWSKTRKLIKE